MRIGQGVEWAIHCCVVLASIPPERALPGAKLAELHGVPAAYLAKHLQALSQAGIVEAVPGRRGGYRLARSAYELTLLEIVEAVEGATPAFRCTEIRQRGPVPGPRTDFRRPCGVAEAMRAAEEAWRRELRRTTVVDLLVRVGESVSPVTIRKMATLLQEAMR
ncbi:MAG: RrF2 family transcriptional regulator [Acidimicrobiales bacterium]